MADIFVIVDNVQFVKRGPFGWIHRNKIRTEKGWSWLTVPVLTKGKWTQDIKDVKIDNSLPWQRKHWKTIEWNYRDARFFNLYRDIFQEIYQRNWEWLAELNEHIIRKILDSLGIKIRIEKTSEMAVTGKASELIVNFCRRLNATGYLSGLHGKDYLDRAIFNDNGIELIFQDFKHPIYDQAYKGRFEPNLSVIDLLFNYGPASLDVMLGKAGNEFVEEKIKDDEEEL